MDCDDIQYTFTLTSSGEKVIDVSYADVSYYQSESFNMNMYGEQVFVIIDDDDNDNDNNDVDEIADLMANMLNKVVKDANTFKMNALAELSKDFEKDFTVDHALAAKKLADEQHLDVMLLYAELEENVMKEKAARKAAEEEAAFANALAMALQDELFEIERLAKEEEEEEEEEEEAAAAAAAAAAANLLAKEALTKEATLVELAKLKLLENNLSTTVVVDDTVVVDHDTAFLNSMLQEVAQFVDQSSSMCKHALSFFDDDFLDVDEPKAKRVSPTPQFDDDHDDHDDHDDDFFSFFLPVEKPRYLPPLLVELNEPTTIKEDEYSHLNFNPLPIYRNVSFSPLNVPFNKETMLFDFIVEDPDMNTLINFF